MSRAAAAVLQWTLELEERELADRRWRGRELVSRMSGVRNVVPARAITGGEPGFLRLPVLDQTGTRAPRAELGILRGYPMTLDQHSQLQPLLLSGERAGKGSLFLRDRLFTMPTHSHVRQSDLARLGEWFEKERLDSRAIVAVL
jgi:hypothetical protein